jgi:hypothetical protein
MCYYFTLFVTQIKKNLRIFCGEIGEKVGILMQPKRDEHLRSFDARRGGFGYLRVSVSGRGVKGAHCTVEGLREDIRLLDSATNVIFGYATSRGGRIGGMVFFSAMRKS